MHIELARDVLKAAFRSGRELQQLLPALKAGCDEAEYQAFAKGIAAAIAEIDLEVMNRAFAKYPELEAEVDASIKASGDYR